MAKNPSKYTLRARYDFAVDGGANGAANHIALADNVVFPENAIITSLVCYTSTQANGGGGCTFKWVVGKADSTTDDVDLSSADGFATYADESVVTHTDGGKVKNSVAGDNVLKLDVGSADATAGVIDIYAEYYQSFDV
tara:strand:+ start:336 stop:749 length:414 start_codon:yes stop_codon:yes gene_type:complete